MGFSAKIIAKCDGCGYMVIWEWTDKDAVRPSASISVKEATAILRQRDWQIGKTGWFCPDCRTRKRSSK